MADKPRKSPIRCAKCGGALPKGRRKFCSDRCSNAWHQDMHRKRNNVGKYGGKAPVAKEPKSSTMTGIRAQYKGDVYERLREGGLFRKIDMREISQKDAATIIGATQGAVSKAFNIWVGEQRVVREAASWKPKNPPPCLCEDHIEELVEHFCWFRDKYFVEPETGGKYIMGDFHLVWLRKILETMIFGRKQLILSPPRHGKTELLVHFCIWMICCVNPNVRILFVGGSEDVAKISVGHVRTHLTENEDLLNDWCPPDRTFKPPYKAQKSWTDKDFTVATRDKVLKTPTMVAVGRGGTLLSRDADIIICDDIEDDGSTNSESGKEKTRRWWATQVMSRKVARTGVFVIGSRQDPDDLYGRILEDERWIKIVEEMHKVDCAEDEDDYSKHVDCMLFPQWRDYKYMKEDLLADELIAATFSMVYLNRPQDEASSTFPIATVERVLDTSRVTGHIPDGPSIRLIGGLDPAGTGYQAAFLWAVHQADRKRYAVDFNNMLGGGIQRAREQIIEWYEKYGLRDWVIEENLYQGAIVKDEILAEICQQRGIHLEPHLTYGNKWDPTLGVSVLATWMDSEQISIPWGSPETKLKWNVYRKQLINFSRDNTRRGKTDIVMASWFPEERIQTWLRNWGAATQYTDEHAYPFEPLSYPFASVR